MREGGRGKEEDTSVVLAVRTVRVACGASGEKEDKSSRRGEDQEGRGRRGENQSRKRGKALSHDNNS